MRKIAMLAALLMLLGCALPAASADDDSLKVVVLLEDKQYSVNSPVKVTVHVFDKAKHVDADKVPTVATGIYPTRAVSVSRTSTGVYEGTFTILPSDLSSGYGVVAATATYGMSDENDTTYNEAEDEAMFSTGAQADTGLSVSCFVKGLSTDIIKPNTKISLEAVVKHNGTAVVPSDISVGLTYDDHTGRSHDEAMTTTNPGVGTYDWDYTVPDLAYDTDFDFEVRARYSGQSDSDTVSVPLNFLQVVYHNISKKATEAVFDIYVADMQGKAVSGATLSVTSRPDGSYSRARTLDAGVTDAQGKARVTLSCDNGTNQLYISGYANASGRSQAFTGSIMIPSGPASAPSPSGDDFEAVYVGRESTYKAGQAITRDYMLFNNSKLWANKDVFLYISTGSVSLVTYSYVVTSVEAKTVTTDGQGRLRLTFTAPSGKDSYFQVDFVTATGIHEKPSGYFGSDHDSVDGQLYSSDSDSFASMKSGMAGTMKVTCGRLNIGSPTQVGAEAKSDDPPMAQVGWMPGQIEDIGQVILQDLDWNIWSGGGAYIAKKGSSYSGSFTIPSFMPHNTKYTIVVYKESDLFSGQNYGTATVSPGQSTTPAKSEFPWLVVGIAIVVIAVVAVAALVLSRRRRPTVAPTAFGQQQGPYPPTPGYQQPPAPAPGAPPVQPYQQQMPPPAQQPAGFQQPPPAAATAPPQPMAAPPQPTAYSPPPGPPQPQATAIPPPSPIPPPPPSVTGPVAMPNNAFCAFCNQWILQGTPGILCGCGKYYHEACAKLQLQCSNCGKVL